MSTKKSMEVVREVSPSPSSPPPLMSAGDPELGSTSQPHRDLGAGGRPNTAPQSTITPDLYSFVEHAKASLSWKRDAERKYSVEEVIQLVNEKTMQLTKIFQVGRSPFLVDEPQPLSWWEMGDE